MMRRAGYAFVLLLMLSFILPIASAQDGYPVFLIDFREVRFSPEEKTSLQNSYTAFRTEPSLITLLDGNNTLFWEHLAGFDSNLDENFSLKSFGLVTVNETGFYQTIVALNAENGNLEWMRRLNETYSANFTAAILTATDFFADAGHYWGVCEEVMIVPGSSVGLSQHAVWNFKFYLVGETERWSLQIDTDGTLLAFQFQDIPCQDCIDYTPLVIIGFASAIVIVFVVGMIVKNRRP
ncbi:MAG: hypothetical protein P1Q69_10165 [Candidatus Thorarchaeota archaeon]|nr:hypothetical protein [Candidatus Thorarchaeota archaeon]